MPRSGGTYLPPVVAELTADSGEFLRKLAEARAALAKLATTPTTAKITANIDAAVATVAALRAGLSRQKVEIPVTLNVDAALAKMALLRTLGIGGGMFGMASLGSVGSLAGFGAEHLAMTGVGLAGSAAGAALGAGALGLGALGTMGVGMGSDILVARDAMKEMTAQTQAFVAVWDNVTRGAKATFVNNVAMPILGVAQGYLPLIAAAAQRNFGIIGQAIKPLLAFLSGPGKQIFADLENVFARNLPTGVGIFVQSLELVLKTIDHIATTQNFGGFLQRILSFVTRLNTTGFGTLMGQVDRIISLFRIWATFVGVLGRDIYDMFSQTVGLGSSIIVTLTGMLERLGAWERSASGKAAMKSLFEAHRQEVLALLKLVPVLVSAVGPIFIQLSTIFTRLAIPLISLVIRVIDFLTHLGGGVGQTMSFALALGLIAAKLNLIGPAITGVMAVMRLMGVTGLLSMGIAGIAIIALIGIIALLATHWKQVQAVVSVVWNFIGPYVRAAIAAISAAIRGFVAGAKTWWIEHQTQVIQVWNAIVGFLKPLVALLVAYLKVSFTIIATFLKVVWDNITTLIKIAWETIKTIFTVALDLVTGRWKQAWRDLLSGARAIFIDIVGGVKSLVEDILAPFGDLPTRLFNIGTAIIQGLINGIKSMVGAVENAIQGVVDTIKRVPVLGKLLGSPSPYFIEVGMAIGEGTAIGVAKSASSAVAAAAKLAAQLKVSGGMGSAGLAAAGGGSGRGGGSITLYFSPNITISGPVTNNPQSLSKELRKQLQEQLQDVLKGLKGGSYMPGQGLA